MKLNIKSRIDDYAAVRLRNLCYKAQDARRS